MFPPTTLPRAIDKLGFVQADPIRAPARAQDLTLRHRVKGYRAGDLERRYPELDLEEGFFINYGFLRRADYLLMHPRKWPGEGAATLRVKAMLAFIRAQGAAHPREIEARFGHGKATNYWGGSSNATTHLLGIMHYRSLLRVVRREAGIRVYAALNRFVDRADARKKHQHLDRLIDIIVQAYAPLPSASLAATAGRLRWATPQWRGELKRAIARARQRLGHARVDGVEWYWPAADRPERARDADQSVRLLSPFDPIVWDRRRFELFWNWAYRFEAYTPAAKRKLGYYALPLLWRDRVIGWCNAATRGNALDYDFGFVEGRPRDRRFGRALEAECARLQAFLF